MLSPEPKTPKEMKNELQCCDRWEWPWPGLSGDRLKSEHDSKAEKNHLYDCIILQILKSNSSLYHHAHLSSSWDPTPQSYRVKTRSSLHHPDLALILQNHSCWNAGLTSYWILSILNLPLSCGILNEDMLLFFLSQTGTTYLLIQWFPDSIWRNVCLEETFVYFIICNWISCLRLKANDLCFGLSGQCMLFGMGNYTSFVGKKSEKKMTAALMFSEISEHQV